MFVLFGSITMLFGASIVGYLITRSQNDIWKTASMPGLPVGLLGSTLLLGALSFAMHRALHAVRENRFERLSRSLLLALLLGVAFVLGQGLNWRAMYGATTESDARTLYGFTFYMLTGLHALHMVIGLGIFTVLTYYAWKGRYTPEYHTPIELGGLYWHFVDIVWIYLFPLLYLIDRKPIH